MRRRTKRTAVAVLATGGVLAGLGFLAETADAAITDPVSYVVGGTADGQEGVRVFFTRARNESCSVSRVVANETGVPVRTLMWVTWDGQLEPVLPKPGTSAMDGDDDLAPGEANTIVFTNHDHVSDTATGLILHTAWTLAGEGIVVAQHAEAIEPCRVADVPPVDTVPPPVDTTPESVPVSSTTPPPPVDEAAPPTTAVVETEVLTSSVGPLEELPKTGPAANAGLLTLIGVALAVVGVTLVKLGRQVGRR